MEPALKSPVFGPLAGLREKPIPDQGPTRARHEGFRRHPIDRLGPHGNEPLVDLKTCAIAGENYYHTTRNPPYWGRIEGSVPSLLLRARVAQKLQAVNAQLAAADLELFVFDAWRPRAVQVYFHDVWMPAELRRRDPSLSGAALLRDVELYWAAPTTDPGSPAPHATGGAVDLTLRWRGGEQLWMGSIFDDATAIAHRDHYERNRDSAPAFSDEEARANRRLLHWVMTAEGFAGHPYEWWHFSWGDQLWAALAGVPAHYGPARDD